jgi:hypothetical protein
MQAISIWCNNTYKNYSQDNGLWEGCVLIDDYFGGSCANYYYNLIDPRYSFSTYLTFWACFGLFRS